MKILISASCGCIRSNAVKYFALFKDNKIFECVIDNAPFGGESMSLASGMGRRIAEIANMFVQNFSKQNQIIFTEEIKIGDPQNWRADISYLKKLGFTTKVSI